MLQREPVISRRYHARRVEMLQAVCGCSGRLGAAERIAVGRHGAAVRKPPNERWSSTEVWASHRGAALLADFGLNVPASVNHADDADS